MHSLGEGVPGPFAVSPELGIYDDELGPRMNCFGVRDPGFEPADANRAPSSAQSAEAQLRRRLKRDKCRSPNDERFVHGRHPGAEHELSAVDVGVDNDRPPR
jgi:hypothetical protein